MQKQSLLVWGCVILAVVMAIGEESQQSWKLRPTGDPGTVYFSIHRYRPGSNWSWNSDVPLTRFHNLSSATLERGGRTEFEYVTDAGKLICRGSFSWNSGAGSFTFVPNPDFVAELRSLGYGTPDQDQAWAFMMSDVTLDFARAVRDAGLHATTGQLLDLRHHGVDAEYLRDLKGYGYDFSASDVIELRNHGVSADFLRDLKRAGYAIPAGQIAELRMHGVGSDFLRDLRSLGLHPRAEDILQFRMHGISADYLNDLKAAGYGGLTAGQVVQLRMHGVPADFAAQAQELGYRFTPQELIELRQHGVSAEYLRTLKESGIRTLSAEQITRLRQHGVD
ncbi:conserved exported hypothetical protein [Candidatus Sulfopaludibacter sp. SbA3]|nr:conserved exported hypothetical protein [Candidatus Sulfopaludibacter sp. SbA3]